MTSPESERQEKNAIESLDQSVCTELREMGIEVNEAFAEELMLTVEGYDVEMNARQVVVHMTNKIGDLDSRNPEKEQSPEQDIEVIKQAIRFRDELLMIGFHMCRSGADLGYYGVSMRKAFAGTFSTDAVKEIRALKLRLRFLRASQTSEIK